MIRRIKRHGNEDPDCFEKTALRVTGSAFYGVLCYQEGKVSFEKAKAGSFACTCGGSCTAAGHDPEGRKS